MNIAFLIDNLNYESTYRNDFGLDWGNITSSLRWNHLFSNKLFANTTLTYSKYQFNTYMIAIQFRSSSPYELTQTLRILTIFLVLKTMVQNLILIIYLILIITLNLV